MLILPTFSLWFSLSKWSIFKWLRVQLSVSCGVQCSCHKVRNVWAHLSWRHFKYWMHVFLVRPPLQLRPWCGTPSERDVQENNIWLDQIKTLEESKPLKSQLPRHNFKQESLSSPDYQTPSLTAAGHVLIYEKSIKNFVVCPHFLSFCSIVLVYMPISQLPPQMNLTSLSYREAVCVSIILN